MSTTTSLITDRALMVGATEMTWSSVSKHSPVSKSDQNNVFTADDFAVTVRYQTHDAVGHVREGVLRRDQDQPVTAGGLAEADWRGNFTPGDALLWTRQQATNDPIILVFAPQNGRKVTMAGVQIQRAEHGPFTAVIVVNDTAGKPIATFQHKGISADHFDLANPANNAPFIGAGAAAIGSIEIRPQVLCKAGFCINQLSVVY